MMSKITNPIFTATEKTHLEFVLQHEFPERNVVIDQLNSMNEDDITRDISPYYWIMEFRPNGINAGHGPMRSYISIEVLHEGGIAPTEFYLYERNGVVFELEIYNADSSAMDLDTIMSGKILVRSAE